MSLISKVMMVAFGGALGAAMRYFITYLFESLGKYPSLVPTFLVNIGGAFLIGLLFALIMPSSGSPSLLYLTLATGFCGGFTTVSTFTLEVLRLFQAQRIVAALIYMGLTLVCTVLFVAIGYYGTRLFSRVL